MVAKSPWNSLEAAKVATSLMIPIVVVLVGFRLGQLQHESTMAANKAAGDRSREFQAVQERQARDFQRQLTRSNQAFSRALQQSDITARAQAQAVDLRWRKLLQDESERREQEARLAEVRRGDEIRASDIRRSDDSKEQVAEHERKESVAMLSRAIFERRVRAVLLSSALRRRDATRTPISEQEVVSRKAKYDEAFAEWNAGLKANLFRVRRVLQQDGYSLLESEIEFTLGGKLFAEIDACLTRAYDQSMSGGQASPVLSECSMSAMLQDTLDCGYAVSEALFQLARTESALESDRQAAVEAQCQDTRPNS